MIANILRARWAWLFISSSEYQTWHRWRRMYTVHSAWSTGVTSPHSSNSKLRLNNKRNLSKKHSAFSLVYRALDLKTMMQIFMRLASRDQFLRLREGYFFPYGVCKTSSDIWVKEAARLCSNTIKYNIGKISLTVWSLFQCQCYRYNTNVPVRRRNSNGMPRSKLGSGNKKGGLQSWRRWLQYAQDEPDTHSSYGQRCFCKESDL